MTESKLGIIANLKKLLFKCQQVEETISSPEFANEDKENFNPRNTFLWLALFAETVHTLSELNEVDEDVAVYAEPVLDVFSAWHQEEKEGDLLYTGGKIKVAVKMSASDILSLSKCYLVLVDCKSILGKIGETHAVVECGLNILLYQLLSHGLEPNNLRQWIHDMCQGADREQKAHELQEIVSVAPHLGMALKKSLVSIAQIVKAFARCYGEQEEPEIGISLQLCAIEILRVVTERKPDISLQIIQEMVGTKRHKSLRISLVELYNLVINNAISLKRLDLAIELNYEYMQLIEKKMEEAHSCVQDVEELYRAYERYGRILYRQKKYTESLEMHEKALELIEKSPLPITNRSIQKMAHFLIANCLENQKKYREALPYARAACVHAEALVDNGVSEPLDSHIFFLAGSLEYRCALEIDSKTETPPVSAVIELLKRAKRDLKNALDFSIADATLYSQKVIALQLAILLIDLKEEQNASVILRDYGITRDLMLEIEQRRMGARVSMSYVLTDPMMILIYSVPVWSILMRLAPSSNSKRP